MYTATTNDHSVGGMTCMPTCQLPWKIYLLHMGGSTRCTALEHSGRTVYMFGTGRRISVDNKLKIENWNWKFIHVCFRYSELSEENFPFSMQSLIVGIS